MARINCPVGPMYCNIPKVVSLSFLAAIVKAQSGSTVRGPAKINSIVILGAFPKVRLFEDANHAMNNPAGINKNGCFYY